MWDEIRYSENYVEGKEREGEKIFNVKEGDEFIDGGVTLERKMTVKNKL